MSDRKQISNSKDTTTEILDGTLYHLSISWENRLYIILVSCFSTLLVLTNMIGVKLFEFELPFEIFGQTKVHLVTGLLTYPLTFLITDIVSEIYGKRRADFMVWIGFGLSLLMLALVQLTIAITPSGIWSPLASLDLDLISDSEGMQESWEAVFGLGPWLVTGSMCAYVVAQLCDNFLFHFWRRLTKGRHLWLRNNASTMVSQIFDTFIVNSFLFYGAFGWEFVAGLKVMAAVYLVKVGIAAMDTPLCYIAIAGIRRFLRSKGAFDA